MNIGLMDGILMNGVKYLSSQGNINKQEFDVLKDDEDIREVIEKLYSKRDWRQS